MEKLAAWQREAPRATPFAQRLDMWRCGFHASAYALCDLSPGRSSGYLPDSSRLDIAFINGSFAHNVLNDKLLFTKLVRVLTVLKVVALLARGEVYAEGRATTLRELVSTHRSLILKPSEGTHGQSTASSSPPRCTSALTRRPGKRWLHSSRTLDTYLVTPTVKQARLRPDRLRRDDQQRPRHDLCRPGHPRAVRRLRAAPFRYPGDEPDRQPGARRALLLRQFSWRHPPPRPQATAVDGRQNGVSHAPFRHGRGPDQCRANVSFSHLCRVGRVCRVGRASLPTTAFASSRATPTPTCFSLTAGSSKTHGYGGFTNIIRLSDAAHPKNARLCLLCWVDICPHVTTRNVPLDTLKSTGGCSGTRPSARLGPAAWTCCGAA